MIIVTIIVIMAYICDDVDDCFDHLSFLGGDVVVVVTGAVVGPSTFQIISIVCTIILNIIIILGHRCFEEQILIIKMIQNLLTVDDRHHLANSTLSHSSLDPF